LHCADQNGITATRRAVLPHSGQAGAGPARGPSAARQHGPHIQGTTGAFERFLVQVLTVSHRFTGRGANSRSAIHIVGLERSPLRRIRCLGQRLTRRSRGACGRDPVEQLVAAYTCPRCEVSGRTGDDTARAQCWCCGHPAVITARVSRLTLPGPPAGWGSG
jgi:hypothetical protein